MKKQHLFTLLACLLYPMLHVNDASLLSDFNLHLRRMYKEATANVINNITYLRVHGYSLSLTRNTKLLHTKDILTNTSYDLLKEVSHVSLGIFATFVDKCGQNMTEQNKNDFNDILKYLQTAMLMKLEFANETVFYLMANMLFDFSQSFVASLLKPSTPFYDCKLLENYRNQIVPIITMNVHQAARFNLLSLHKEVRYMRRTFPDVDWKNIYILICGAHMAREKNLVVSYFQELYKIHYEGKQLVFSEDSSDVGCINTLTTHILDEGLSLNFFHESLRMHRDLLGDAAESILSKMELTFD